MHAFMGQVLDWRSPNCLVRMFHNECPIAHLLLSISRIAPQHLVLPYTLLSSFSHHHYFICKAVFGLLIARPQLLVHNLRMEYTCCVNP